MSTQSVSTGNQLWNVVPSNPQNRQIAFQSSINTYKEGNAYELTLSQEALQKAKKNIQSNFSSVIKGQGQFNRGIKNPHGGAAKSNCNFVSSLVMPLADGKSIVQSQSKGNIINLMQ